MFLSFLSLIRNYKISKSKIKIPNFLPLPKNLLGRVTLNIYLLIIFSLLILSFFPIFINANQDQNIGVFISEINFRGSINPSTNCSGDAKYIDLELETVTSGGLCNYDQWFELTNTTSKPIDISGWVVSFRPKKKPTPRFIFPGNTLIKAGQSIIIGFTGVSKDPIIKSKLEIASFQSVLADRFDFTTDQIFYISNDQENNTTLRIADSNDQLVDSAVFSQSSLGEKYKNRGQSFYRCNPEEKFIPSPSTFIDDNYGSPGVNPCPKKTEPKDEDLESKTLPLPIIDNNQNSSLIQELNPSPVINSQPSLVENTQNQVQIDSDLIQPGPITELIPNSTPITDQLNPKLENNFIQNPTPDLSSQPSQEITRRAKPNFSSNQDLNQNPLLIATENKNLVISNSQSQPSLMDGVQAPEIENHSNLEVKLSNLNNDQQITKLKPKIESVILENKLSPSKSQNTSNSNQLTTSNLFTSQTNSPLKQNLENQDRNYLYWWFSLFVVFNLLAYWITNIDKEDILKTIATQAKQIQNLLASN